MTVITLACSNLRDFEEQLPKFLIKIKAKGEITKIDNGLDGGTWWAIIHYDQKPD